jgi:NitT/TauT family transport system substrate-binding protein
MWKRLGPMLVGFLLAAHVAGAESLKVTTGSKTNWDSCLAALGVSQGFFKSEGLDVEVTFTDGGAATLQPAVSGDVDIAFAVGTLAVLSAIAKDAPIKIISSEATGAHERFWYVKAGSPIKTLQDGAGKTIGYSAPGATSHLLLLALINQEKVALMPVPTGPAPATMVQVMSGQIDIGHSLAPFGLQEAEDGKIAIIARSGEVRAMQNEAVRVNVANANSLAAKRDAISRFMRAYVRTVDWAYRDPRAIEAFAAGWGTARDVTARALTEYYPKSMLQIGEIKGLPQIVDEAVKTNRIAAPLTPDQLARAIDIVYQPGEK